MIHSRMLGLSVVVRRGQDRRAVLRVGLRTVDVGAHRKGRVVGESFCSVVIGTVDVCVVLKCSKYRRRRYMRGDLHWSRHCTASSASFLARPCCAREWWGAWSRPNPTTITPRVTASLDKRCTLNYLFVRLHCSIK